MQRRLNAVGGRYDWDHNYGWDIDVLVLHSHSHNGILGIKVVISYSVHGGIGPSRSVCEYVSDKYGRRLWR